MTAGLLAFAGAWLAIATLGMTPRQSVSAERLVAAVLDSRATTGFRLHARVTRTGEAGETTTQLLITGRRDGARTDVLYRAIAPAEAAGRAILIRDAGDHRPTGVRFDRTAATPIAASEISEAFFGSDLRLEDVFEGFWYWRSPTIVGEERIDGRVCEIVEFRPSAGTPTHYARVRAWIAASQALPLRVEQFGADNRREKRISAGRIVKRGDRWAAARLFVEPDNSRSRTVFEATRLDRDLVLPAADFTPEAIARALRREETR